MLPLQTARLTQRELTEDDAPLMLAILNDPDFIRYVADRGVRTEEDARRHIADGPMASYRDNGFGMYRVELKDGTAIGLCGLVKRNGLEDVDIGFAFLPQYRTQGYALEAAQAVMKYGREQISLRRIVAIANPGNGPSLRLLEKLGMKAEGRITLPGKSKEVQLMAWETAE